MVFFVTQKLRMMVMIMHQFSALYTVTMSTRMR
jgi:hypothetical protein